ncbi:hypothetical protein KXR83_05615 [Williamsia muralis]|uniref:DUF7352 domain-containing protein n=1 Tax=Williamsia marianensis TaxID=85044 RepID=UPI003F176579
MNNVYRRIPSVVHRVALPLQDTQTLQLRGFVAALHVERVRTQILARENDQAAFELWYEAIPGSDELLRVDVHVAGTGHQFKHDGQYIGTFTQDDGDFVWHVFVEYPVTSNV